MTCREVDERLDDYLDGALSEREFQELELHLSDCHACRGQERGLRSLVAQAAALQRELTPARDLWPGIAARLGRRSPLAFSPKPGTLRVWLPVALAAAALLALAFGFALESGLVAPPRQASTQPSDLPRAVGVSTQPSDVLEAEREYAKASATLMAALDARRERLTPETLAAVGTDLRVIDQALADIRKALEQDPASGALNHLLVSTHLKKVKVLQRVVKLSRI